MDALKKEGRYPMHVEGLEAGGWVVIDYCDYMIHMFEPGFREKYRLEEIFQRGEIVHLNLD